MLGGRGLLGRALTQLLGGGRELLAAGRHGPGGPGYVRHDRAQAARKIESACHQQGKSEGSDTDLDHFDRIIESVRFGLVFGHTLFRQFGESRQGRRQLADKAPRFVMGQIVGAAFSVFSIAFCATAGNAFFQAPYLV